MENNIEEKITAEDKRKRETMLWVGGIALSGVVGLCVMATLVFVALDPFGWLWGRRGGAAEVMPANTVIYLSLDISEIESNDELDSLLAVFADATGDDVESLGDFLDQVDQEMEDDFGITLSDDVLPWIGASVGLGLIETEEGSFIENGESDWLLALEVRDSALADDFVDKLVDEFEDPDEDAEEGITILNVYGSQVAIGMADDFVLIGSTEDVVQEAQEIQSGDALWGNRGYRKVTRQLPHDRLFSMYVNSEIYNSLFESLEGLAATPTTTDLEFSGAFGLSVSVVEEGIRVDLASWSEDVKTTAGQREMQQWYMDQGELNTPSIFPENTVMFMVAGRMDLTSAEVLETAFTDPDMAEAFGMLDEQFGISIFDDLFPLLDGEFALGLVPLPRGILSGPTLGIGFMMAAETSDEAALLELLEVFNEGIEASLAEMDDPTLDLSLETVELEGMTVYEVSMGGGGLGISFPVVAYGVGEGYLIIASDADTIEDALSEGPSLADNEYFLQMQEAFPDDQFPILYFDVQGFIEMLSPFLSNPLLGGGDDFGDSVAVLEPITIIALSVGYGPESGTAHEIIIIFIDKD